MDGTLTQILALTCYANAYLQGSNFPNFYPDHPACSNCEQINFTALHRKLFAKARVKVIAQSPDDWFVYLKKKKATGVFLSRTPENQSNVPDRMLAGFVGGGGTWTMNVTYPHDICEIWASKWVFKRDVKNHHQGKWQVQYTQLQRLTFKPTWEDNYENAYNALQQSLFKIQAFSQQHQCDGFTKCFDQALEVLNHTAAPEASMNQCFPANLFSAKMRDLIIASSHAWVFGCMGSWNDMMFDGEDQVTYDHVSESLFNTLTRAIELAGSCTHPLFPKGN